MFPVSLKRLPGWRLSLAAPLLYMAALFGLSSVPGVIPEDAPVPYQIFNWVPPAVQNLLHIPVYAGLAFLWCWALAALLRPVPATVAAFLITVAYGVFEEGYQSFVPGRCASLTDVLFNTIGACLGLLAFHWFSRFADQRKIRSS